MTSVDGGRDKGGGGVHLRKGIQTAETDRGKARVARGVPVIESRGSGVERRGQT